MFKMSQKEAVYAAVTSVLKDRGIVFKDGMNVGTIMTSDLRARVISLLIEGFKSGRIKLDKEFNNNELQVYVASLLSNWLRKDKRLNGGVAYLSKTQSRSSNDPELQTLMELLKLLVDEAQKADLQVYIDARIRELEEPRSTK